MKKGLFKRSETTSAAGDQFLIDVNNFEPSDNGIKIREGASGISNIDVIIAAEKVTISGLDIVLMVTKDGALHATIPQKYNSKYKVYRRYYQTIEFMKVNTDDIAPVNNAKIKEVGKFIYVLTNDKSWAIRKDGVAYFKDVGLTSLIIVDAIDATIYDADDKSFELYQTDNYSSTMPEGSRIYCRVRNEMGGRGSKSLVSTVNKTDSYVAVNMPGEKHVTGISAKRRYKQRVVGYGIKGLENSATDTFFVNFDCSDDRNVNYIGKKLGISNKDVTNKWRNVTVTNQTVSAFSQQLTVDNSFSNTYTGLVRLEDYWDTSTVGAYTFHIIDPTGDHYLITDSSSQPNYPKGTQYCCGQFAFNMNDSATVNWINSPLFCEVLETPQNFTVNSVIKSPAFRWYTTDNITAFDWTIGGGNTGYIAKVSVHGMPNTYNEMNGSAILDSSSSNPNFMSYIPYFIDVYVDDNVGDNTDSAATPFVFTEPFEVVPTSSATLTRDISYTRSDNNVWLRKEDHNLVLSPESRDNVVYLSDENNRSGDNGSVYDIVSYDAATDSSMGDAAYYYDFYAEGRNQLDVWLGGSYHNREKQDYADTSATANFTGNSFVSPVMFSKTNIYKSFVETNNTYNVQGWDNVEFFAGSFWFAEQNQIKRTNAFLEWDKANTYTVDADITDMVSMKENLYIFTKQGIFTVNAKGNVSKFDTRVIDKAISVENKIFMTDSSGKIYILEFVTSGFGSQIQTKVLSRNIKDDADSWFVYDMAYHENYLWVASDIGVYKVEVNENSWWKMSYNYDTITKLIPFNERLLAYSCNVTPANLAGSFVWSGSGGGPQ